MATSTLLWFVTLVMLYTLIIRYQRSLSSKVRYDANYNNVMYLNKVSDNFLCHLGISCKKFPFKTRPPLKSRGRNKAYLALLLILSGDIELNPGPDTGDMCVDCKISEGKLCQDDLVLCGSCEELRLKPSSSDASKKDEIVVKQKGKKVANKKARSVKEQKKNKKPLLSTNKITDLKSVYSIYDIKTDQPIPKEHPSSFLNQFENKPHYSYTTDNTRIATTIFAYHKQIYDKIGEDKEYDISWTDLINTEDNSLDEILIEIEKNNEHWVDIRIYIPSATVCINGEGTNDFRKCLLNIINQQQELLYSDNKENPVNDVPILISTPESDFSSGNKSDLGDALKPVWQEIEILKIQMAKITSSKENASDDREKLRKENTELKIEKANLLAEIRMLKKEVEDLKNSRKLEKENQWQTIPKKPTHDNYNSHHNNNQKQPFHQPVFNNLPTNNMQMFFHPNKFHNLQFIPQDTPLSSLQNSSVHPVQTIPRNANRAIHKPSETAQAIARTPTTTSRIPPHTLATSQPNVPLIERQRNAAGDGNQQQQQQQRSSNDDGTYNRSNSNVKQNVVLIGDSMIKNVLPHKLSKSLNSWVSKISISGMRGVDLKHYIIPSIAKHPDVCVIHCGINDLMNTKISPEEIGKNLEQIADTIKRESPTCKIFFSSIIHQAKYQNLNSSVEELNEHLIKVCQRTDFMYIDNSNVKSEHLNGSQLHLNKKGDAKLACNFRDCIKASHAA